MGILQDIKQGAKSHKESYDLLVAAGADLTIKCTKHARTPSEELDSFKEKK